MNWLGQLAYSRLPWLLLAAIAAILEVCALFFQYQMGLAPCIMCIYQRTAVLGIMFAGLIGAIAPRHWASRLSGLALWLVSAIWGYFIAKEHIEMQTTTDPFAFSCEIEPNFPDFLPLHHMIPSFFEATGDCGNIDWQFMGLSMPSWMSVIFALFSIAAIAITLTHFMSKPKP